MIKRFADWLEKMSGLLTMLLIIVIATGVIAVGIFIADSHLRKRKETKQLK